MNSTNNNLHIASEEYEVYPGKKRMKMVNKKTKRPATKKDKRG